VAKKEHAQIVEVLKYIESLRPGLYLMEIKETKSSNGKIKYEVSVEERRLEDLRRLNKLERRDEKPFEVVAEFSAFGEKAYTLFVRPFMRPLVNETAAELGRLFHPLRWQRWALSDMNPWMWPVAILAPIVKEKRCAAPPENDFRRAEKAASDLFVAGLNWFRDVRDAKLESLFFQIYGPPAVLGLVPKAAADVIPGTVNPRELPIVQQALASIGKGGYAEAMALIGALIGRGAGRIPIARLELVDRFVRTDEVLSQLSTDEVRRIKAEQAVVAELEPERGLQSLPKLLAKPSDRRRALEVLDEAVVVVELTDAQKTMLDRVLEALGAKSTAAREGNRTESRRQFTATT
jgi:hypothetical protein